VSALQTRDKRWFSLKPVILTEVFPPVRSAEFPEYLKTMSLFQKLRFHITVNHMRDLPDTRREIAFVGRSNAGKSSALNTLANHVRLAYVSKTPGRTQHINYFSLGDDLYLVDLPGYGYAQVPVAVRAHWEKLLGQYLQTRRALIGLVLIMDSRHPLKELDWNMLNWFSSTGKPVHLVLTKSDKLTRQESAKVLLQVKDAVADLPHCSVQLFSSLKKQGVKELDDALSKWLLEPDVEPDEDEEVFDE
jgi:GTP-binding protein